MIPITFACLFFASQIDEPPIQQPASNTFVPSLIAARSERTLLIFANASLNVFVDASKQDYVKNLDLEENSSSDDELDDTDIKSINLDELHDANTKSINLDDEICKKSIGTQCDVEDIYDYIEWIFVK